MPDAAEIQRNLTGAWRLMMGRTDGMRMLDTSAEGFWDSFFAIVVAAPALAVGWIANANDFQQVEAATSRLSVVVRLAIVDLAAWILPLVALAFILDRMGIADRFAPYVVSTNWASTLLAWMALPLSIVRLMAPEATEIAVLLWVVLSLISIVLVWRLTNAVLNKGPAVATAVFVSMFVTGLGVFFLMLSLLGLTSPDQMPG
jgi:hypothetical protein